MSTPYRIAGRTGWSNGLPDGAEDALPRIAEEISAAERRAMQAECETIDRLIAGWLADRVGAVFRGRISGVTKAGLFIRLDETGALEGIVSQTRESGLYAFASTAYRF